VTPRGDGTGGGPLSRWLIRFDEALARGEAPPEPRPEEIDVDEADLVRFRAFLEMLDRTLRPPDATGLRGAIAERRDELAEEAAIPRAVGRFRIDKELGRGGFGIVFRAFDPDMGRWVALKVPKAEALLDPGIRRRFLGEAHAAAQLDHPNLVPVFEAGEAGSTCYIASAYCEGPTLRSWIEARDVPVEPRRAARLVLAMTRAVEHMHARGFLHCDLKPGNVLLDLPPEGESDADPTPRITDFGLARLADAPVGESTAAKAWGTPPYMAPEQIQQRREAVGAGADLYALGAILYELATGKPPHQADSTWKLMQAVVAEPPAPPRSLNRSIPRDLGAIATKCLEKRPGRRYPSAAALADDLECFLGRRPTGARPLGPLRRLGRWSARNRAATAVLAMTLATLGLSVRNSAALRRANQAALAASARASEAGERDRRRNYVATLALADLELRRGRWAQAQRRLREVVPPPGTDEVDPRDFAWHYLWRQSRRDRTILDDLFPGVARLVSAGDGVLLALSSEEGGGLWRIDRPDGPGAGVLAPIRPSFAFARPGVVDRNLRSGAVSPGGRWLLGTLLGPSGSSTLAAVRRDGTVAAASSATPRRRCAIALARDADAAAFGLPDEARGRDALARDRIEVEGREVLLLGVPEATTLEFTAGAARVASLRAFDPERPDARRLELWDVPSGRRVARLADRLGPALAASPLTAGPIATGTLEGVVQIRDAATGAVLAELPAPEGNDGRVNALAFAPDGRRLLAGYDRRAVLWDVQGRRPEREVDDLSGWVRSAVFLPGDPSDVALGIGTGEVVVWHGRPIRPAIVPGGHDDEVWGVAFAAGGRTLATLGGDGLLKLWDARTGAEGGALPGHEAWPSCLAASPARPVLASGDFAGRVLIWDSEACRLVRSLEAHEDRVWSAAFSPDGGRLATVGRDRTLRLWDASSWSPIATFRGHSGDVRDLAFSPDGRAIVTGGEDRTIVVWDARSGRRLRRWRTRSNVTCLAVAPDGRTLAAGDGSGGVEIRDFETGRSRGHLPTLHREEVGGLAFSPDGRVLASAGQGGVIALIDVESGRPHLTLEGHEGGVNAVAFSPDGRTLASVSHDKTLRLWWAGPAPDGGGG